jgi:hypothetical protein
VAGRAQRARADPLAPLVTRVIGAPATFSYQDEDRYVVRFIPTRRAAGTGWRSSKPAFATQRLIAP